MAQLEGEGVAGGGDGVDAVAHQRRGRQRRGARLGDDPEAVAEGSYRYSVVAANGGVAVNATALSFSQVAAVKQSGGSVALELTAGRSIGLSDVRLFL